MRLDPKVLDRWLQEYSEFNHDFRLYCFEVFRAFDVHCDFVPNVMKQIHTQWVADCETWLKDESHHTTEELSHIKIVSLLLFNLSKENFLGNMYEYNYKDENGYRFQGTDDEKSEAKNDLVDCRECLLAMDFCFIVASFYEMNRKDRDEPFSNRMTIDMRHDLIGYLIDGNVDRKSLYLIVKALYLRKGNGSAL